MGRISGSMETCIYIVDDEYRICHFNNALLKVYPELKAGDICYRALCGEENPCGNCPLQCERNETVIMYHGPQQRWLEVNTSRIEWPGSGMCNFLLWKEIHDGNRNLLYNLTDGSAYEELIEINLTRNTYKLLYHADGKYERPGGQENLDETLQIVCERLIHPEDREAYRNFWDLGTLKQRIRSGVLIGEFRKMLLDGNYCWTAQKIYALKTNKRADDVFMCFIQDITDRKAKESAGSRMADSGMDRLTGLYKKSVFWTAAEEFLEGAQSGTYCLVTIDIEHFKLYNEWYGDHAGDVFLKNIGYQLKEAVDGDGMAAYMGEDDFCMILPNKKEVLQQIQNRLHEFILQNPNNSGFLPVFGVYEVTEDSVPVSTMYDRAVIAMNSVKGNYTNRIGWYDSRMKEKLEKSHVMLSEVQKALEKGEITFYLQPKCSMLNGKIVGMEALVRWKHPERGMVPPGEFISVLEKNGFIPSLDQYIWDKVCAQLHDWISRGIRPVPVSVNVSRIDIYTLNVVEVFTGLIRKYGIPAHLLEVEITETAYAEDADLITTVVDALRANGFCVSMDDFGSGSSSLNMLKDVNVDVLKLDMKFLEMKETSTLKGIGILETVVQMAHLLGLQLIAEGAENQEQVEFLLNMGCVYGQGYYFYRPMEIDAAERLITNENNVDFEGMHWEKYWDKIKNESENKK